MSDNKYAIEVANIKKSFYLPHNKNNSLKSAITQVFKSREKGGETFKVLDGVSFKIEKGDFFGILGRNGSGKSTLLKIISEIYQPTSGTVKRDGKLVSFIELGVGFKAELSGRENVFLNGGLLGFSRAEVEAMYDDIVAFAELEEFMDQKLKNYSSGMKVRLAFSVAIRAKADILVLDEVLAVGDASFQKKCTDYFETLKNDGKTVILVTHSMGNVRRFCNKAVVIEEGKVVYEGEPDGAAEAYKGLFVKKEEPSSDDGDRPVIFAKILSKSALKNTEKLQVEVRYRNTSSRSVYTKLVLYYRKAPIMAANSKVLYGIVTNDMKEHAINYTLPLGAFNQGDISITALLVDSEEETNIASFGIGSDLLFNVYNVSTGQKIGGVMRDAGHMELSE